MSANISQIEIIIRINNVPIICWHNNTIDIIEHTFLILCYVVYAVKILSITFQSGYCILLYIRNDCRH